MTAHRPLGRKPRGAGAVFALLATLLALLAAPARAASGAFDPNGESGGAFAHVSFLDQYPQHVQSWRPPVRFAGTAPALLPDRTYLAAAEANENADAAFGPTGGELPPAFTRPAPSAFRYTLDVVLAAVATVAWKRALNVTAAQRIIIESYENFGETLKTAPPIDDANSWTTNWVAHPLLGMYYYQWFRSRGHNRWMSALGSFIESTLHEYAIETSFEPASGIDIILTPGMGVPMGMVADEISVRWVRSESGTKRFFAYVLNPFLAMPWSKWRRHVGYNPAQDRFIFTVGMDY